MLAEAPTLTDPQERALQVAFGTAVGNPPNRFVVGVAVLSLLAEVATKEPLVCLIDDAQWLDEASAQVIGFVGRRLVAESVLLILAVRGSPSDRSFARLPDLTIEGLSEVDARALLDDSIAGPLNDQVRDRIVAETRGNPLGLLELPRGMTAAELAGGFGIPITATVSDQIEDRYSRRVQALPDATQRLMLLAAADPTGDATLLWRAAHTLGIAHEAAIAADSEQLLEIGTRVRFHHPLVRSATYAAASPEDRTAAHLALAAATDTRTDPERRVWHLAAAATGPDEDVASELERTAEKAQARAGLAAAAAFLQRSVELTVSPERRVDRALVGARAHMSAGAFDAAQALLNQAATRATDDFQRARVEQLRGQIEWSSKPGRDAPAQLLRAAERLETLDISLARETYLDAWIAAWISGALVNPDGDLLLVSTAAQSVPRRAPTQKTADVLLDGLTTFVTDGSAAAEPALRRALNDFVNDSVSADDWLRWGHVGIVLAIVLWDAEGWTTLSARHVELARSSGALDALAMALAGRGLISVWRGEFDAARLLIAEQRAITDVTGGRQSSSGAMLLSAYQGRSAEVASPLPPFLAAARSSGGADELWSNWTKAILDNALGRYSDAFAAATQAVAETHQRIDGWVYAELIEAGVRSGGSAAARDALDKLSATTVDTSDWARGVEARCRALLSDGHDAEEWYTEAIARLGRTSVRTEFARSHLLFGEWLRRKNRRLDARHHLRVAHGTFVEIGAEVFAERARRELVATGEKVRTREPGVHIELTPQEEHIARLAREGRTNPEIGAELFISARTVEWHLGKVFTKLGITSRQELKDSPGMPSSTRHSRDVSSSRTSRPVDPGRN
jgi:DNA-binding CsgD family transcriptional regulator